ncbi:MAG: dodecin family protein [Bacillota bacterium]
MDMEVAKVIELIGQSENSWDDAIRNAVRRAAQTVDNISGVEVLNLTASISDGEIVEYKANVKLAFGVNKA